MVISRVVVAVALLSLVTACGGGGDSEGEAAPKPASQKNVSYDSVVGLRDAYVKAGGSCDGWQQTDKISSALESGECGTDTVLSIYVDRDEAKAAADNLVSIASELGGQEASVLVGPNWVVNNDADSDGLLPYKRKLGGTIVTAY